MSLIPNEYQDLLRDETRAFMVLSVLLADGSPIMAPIWFAADGDECFIMTDADSLKARCMRARPRIAFTLMTEGNMVRYLHVRGTAIERTNADMQTIYRRIVRKYEHQDPTEYPPMTLFAFKPERVSGFDYGSFKV